MASIGSAKTELSKVETTTAMIRVRFEARLPAMRSGTYPISRIALTTMARDSSETISGRRNARETVIGETPAFLATSSMRTRPLRRPRSATLVSTILGPFCCSDSRLAGDGPQRVGLGSSLAPALPRRGSASGGEASEGAKDCQGFLGLWPRRVVRIGFDGGHDAVPADHDPCRDGEPPARVAVEAQQIEAEAGIDGLQRRRELEGKTVSLTDGVARIGEDRKRQFVLFRAWFGEFGQLRGQRHQLGAELPDIGQYGLQSLQLMPAIGSPKSAKDRQHHGPPGHLPRY